MAATIDRCEGRSTMTADPLSRRRFLGGALTLAGASTLSLAGLPLDALAADTGGVATVHPDPAQTMQGFGASGAWWPIDLARFDRETQQKVAALLFAPAPVGIQLSAYRYNIGGGGLGVTNPSRAPETFQVSPGVYDWTRDAGGRTFLELAHAYQVPVLVGFANSAPAAWTTNHLNEGGNLVPGAETDYARYLVDVVTHFRQAQGITLSHLSPMNEPDYRFEGGGQEGMAVPVQQRAALVQALAAELAGRAPYARVIADESSQVKGQFLPEAAQWLPVDGTADHLAALAHHLYDFPDDSTLRLVRQVGERAGVPAWATEICCIKTSTGVFGQDYDPTIANAILMARLIWQALTQANDAAFHWWVAASSAIGADPSRDPGAALRPNPDGWNDGLVYYDPNFAQNGNREIYVTKRFYALGNLSRYVRPGARRHDVDGVPDPLRVLAFSNELGWTVVAINTAPAGAGAAALELQLPVAGGSLVPVETVETSAVRSLEPVAPPRVGQGLLRATLPAQSITTFVLAVAGP
jgi:O-glycosyl hydrolase